jgi:hypothetical protein
MLNKLNRCCMIGESDSFMMDLDVDNLNNLDVKNNQGRSTAVNFAESNENGSSNGYHNSDNPDRAAKKPTVVTSEEPSTTVDQHLIERIRTSVRKSMYLMQLPEMLCVQISRLVYNPMTGRKMKLPQHVRFDTKLDMSSFQMTPEQHGSIATSRTNSLGSMSIVSTSISVSQASSPKSSPALSKAGSEIPDIDIENEIEDVEPLSASTIAVSNGETSSAAASSGAGRGFASNSNTLSSRSHDADASVYRGSTPTMLSSTLSVISERRRALYDLCAVIVHSGSADGGKHHFNGNCC